MCGRRPQPASGTACLRICSCTPAAHCQWQLAAPSRPAAGGSCLSAHRSSCGGRRSAAGAHPPLRSPCMAHRPARRVVVTGLGLVTPLGTGVQHCWSRLLRGEVATQRCTRVPDELLERMSCHVAAEVEHGTGEGAFDIERWVPADLRRNTRPYVHYALGAGAQALEVCTRGTRRRRTHVITNPRLHVDPQDAEWSGKPRSAYERERAGVAVGVGMVDLEQICAGQTALDKSPRKVSPFCAHTTITVSLYVYGASFFR